MATMEKTDTGYIVRYDEYTSGKRKQHKKSFPTYKDAKAFKVQVEAKVQNGQYADPGKITVGEWLDEWYETHYTDVVDNTRAAVKRNIALIKPFIGNVLLKDLRRAQVQKFYNNFMKTTYKRGKNSEEKHYSPKTLKHIHSTLVQSLNKAIELDMLIVNPAQRTSLPKCEPYDATVPEKDGMNALLKIMEQSQYHAAMWASALLGCRRGEMLGISWSDVDFKRGLVRIERNYKPNNLKGGAEIGSLKTKRSERTVPLPGLLADILMRWKVQQKVNTVQFGEVYIKSNFVFTNERGAMISPSTISHKFKCCAIEAGLPTMRLHDLREAYASHLIDGGANPKVVQDLLGHTTPEFTMRVYAKSLGSGKQKAGDIVEQMYGDLK